MKRVIVLWSGGLDSTYLVYSNLLSGNHVTALYIEISNNKEKTIREKKAIETISSILKEKISTQISLMYPITISVECNTDNIVLGQAYIWASIAPIYTSNIDDIDEIQIAYVMNDDAISFMPEIKKIYNSYNGIVRNKLPKLVFPLKKMKKSEFVYELPHEILTQVTSCEDNDEENCECVPCSRFRQIFGVRTGSELVTKLENEVKTEVKLN